MIDKTRHVKIGNQIIGGGRFSIIAGPCSIESEDQFLKTAVAVKSSGAQFLRGGMFKLRTNPESFQGLGKEAFQVARSVKSKVQLPLFTEVTDPRQISDMYEIVDAFQVGSRNMHNYSLLKELGNVDKPILLKRGFSGLIDEWILAAQYVEKAGNPNVILCERGIRTFETATRNTFDINAIAFIKAETSYPIIADPSHGVGRSDLVAPVAYAAAAAGADGIIVEVHPEPEKAMSDGYQALTIPAFEKMVSDLEKILNVFEKSVKKDESCHP